jgi:hypothetical protein
MPCACLSTVCVTKINRLKISKSEPESVVSVQLASGLISTYFLVYDFSCPTLAIIICAKYLLRKKLKRSRYTPWRRLGERIYIYIAPILNLDTRRSECAASCPLYIKLRGPEPVWARGLNKNPLLLRGSNPGRPVRSQTLQ